MKTLKLIAARATLAVLLFVVVLVAILAGLATGTLVLLALCYCAARDMIRRD